MARDPDAMLFRQLKQLEWRDPEPFLREVARVEPAAAVSRGLLPATRALRANSQKLHRERWHAAMFAHGVGCRNRCKTVVCVPGQGDSGYELLQQLGADAFVAMLEPPDHVHYGLVQLKELVGDGWNSTASIQGIADILNDRTRYPDPSRTHAVIYVSRGCSLDVGNIQVDDRWMSVWILGSIEPGRRRLSLVGDIQKAAQCRGTDFDYPLPKVAIPRPRIWAPR